VSDEQRHRDGDGTGPPDELLAAAVGAVVFASGEPVQPREIAAAFGDTEVAAVEAAIESLSDVVARSGLGLRIEPIAGGYRLATTPDVGPWVRRYFRQRNRTRLSPAALETLAIVAYRQPVTAPEIQSIRGKDPSASLKNLLDKRLLRVLGRKKVVGNPILYGTTKQFLVHFGLDSLEDLPSIEDFDEFVGALEAGQGNLFVREGQPDEEQVGDDEAGENEVYEPLDEDEGGDAGTPS